MKDLNATESANSVFADLRVRTRWDWLLITFSLFLGLMFTLTSLDILVGSTDARSVSSGLLNALCLDTRLFAGQVWRVITVQWLHGSFGHLAGNLGGLWFAWWLFHRVVPGKDWFRIFVVGGAIAGAIHVWAKGSPPPDFSQWTGTLGLYFFQPGTGLVGASGGAMALLGAVTTISLRYWLLRKSVPNYLGLGPLAFLALIAMQTYGDLTTSGVAGLAHQAGLWIGMVWALFLPIVGNPSLLVSRTTALSTIRTISSSKVPRSVSAELSDDFNQDTDFVVVRREWIGFGKRRSHTDIVLAGTPVSGSDAVRIPLT